MNLSDHFTLGELTRTSVRNFDNTPPRLIVDRLRVLCQNVLEPVRAHFAKPVVVFSGYRSPEVNKAVGGALASQHIQGEAADFEIRDVSHPEVARWIVETLDFDQIILEFCTCAKSVAECGGWIHCSYSATKLSRKNILAAKRTLSGTSYRVITAALLNDFAIAAASHT